MIGRAQSMWTFPRFVVSVLALTTLVHFGNEARSQDEAEIAFQMPQDPPDPNAGQLLEWECWSFRWQFRDIEGLMLSDVYFRGRKVLKAINLAEIYVPYTPGVFTDRGPILCLRCRINASVVSRSRHVGISRRGGC